MKDVLIMAIGFAIWFTALFAGVAIVVGVMRFAVWLWGVL